MSVASKPGYKESSIGWIPQDWSSSCIGSEVEAIIGGGTPSRDVAEYWDGEIPWASVKDLTATRLSKTAEYITKKAIKESSANLIPAGTLITPTRMALGKVAFFECDVAINQDLKAIFPKQSLSKEFLFFWFQYNAEKIEAAGTGSTVKGIRLEVLREFGLALPPLPQQQKISAILTAVDDKLDVITRQIETYITLKRGLMQSLFNRGAGTQSPNGRWVPHNEFRETELGEIPVSWEVKTIGSVLDIIERPFKMTDDHLYRRVTVKRRYGGIELRDELLGADIKVKSQFLLEAGDFLISERQIVHGACGIVPAHLEGALVSNEYLVLQAKDGFSATYLSYLVQAIKYARLFLICSQGVDIEKFLFKPKDWLKKQIPVPPFAEQCRISEIFATIEDKLKKLKIKQSEYQTIKVGLMQKLLTGEWRVQLDTTTET
ncbi:type I restriction enzyme, S subunit [Geopseudomonas sagittaria]|uniref:Type I restriction enzyme, S subunit n=1 Tax=Geopseudomonas sagittaria TaxID=1135990 RepID=A0A1I5SBB4_9GAMM|nr:restriction endonuclease subunit S [Pseudomonas sagittaria]SFP67586.1 type I restriction enzyme, S subunit [Pseudomonas sagittaria]